jgi:hypothetical protein
MNKGMDWRSFEVSVKTEARFFSRTAASYLTSIFDGIGNLQTREGRSLVVSAGPESGFRALYRARIFQSEEKLETALGRPDIHLGPPPARLATAGRLNARGISVFYGASDQNAAIAEVRPPVGTKIAVAEFEIIRKLRLMDLTAVSSARVTGSLADLGVDGRTKSAAFLRSLGGNIARPVTCDDEPFEYLATQAISDFLATEATVPIDGIIFPSLQALGDAFNVVLFHKAARVEPMNVPSRTEISASTGRWTEDGWVDDYEVVEKVRPPHHASTMGSMGLGAIVGEMPRDTEDSDWRDYTLRIVPTSVEVHHVKRVEFHADEFKVNRHRR